MKTPTSTTSSGYAILFSVLLVSIILAITMGIANIALKELQFTTTARTSHLSFFAADTVGECALYQYRKNNLVVGGLAGPLICGTAIISPVAVTNIGGSVTYKYQNIGVDIGCGSVDVTVLPIETVINAYGYNVNCNALSADRSLGVERLLTYKFLNDSNSGTGSTTTGTTTGTSSGTTSGGLVGGTVLQPITGGVGNGTLGGSLILQPITGGATTGGFNNAN